MSLDKIATGLAHEVTNIEFGENSYIKRLNKEGGLLTLEKRALGSEEKKLTMRNIWCVCK